MIRNSQNDIELQRKSSFDGSLTENAYKFGNFYDTLTYSESLDLDVSYSAPDLHELYRYHVFFSHCNEDKNWVSGIIHQLDSEPYNYKCSYGDFQYANKLSFFQSALCSAMLSERVVVVLTPNYVKTTWKEFREILQNLTEKSLYRQRMLVVLLKDCMIPEPLQQMGFLDARESDFFPCFVKYLGSGEFNVRNCNGQGRRFGRSDLFFFLYVWCTPHWVSYIKQNVQNLLEVFN